MQYLGFSTQALSILIMIFSLVFLSGIIWRVEMKLDISYKLFFAAIVFLIIADIERLVAYDALWLDFVGYVSRLLFAALFFWGIMEMRSLLRDVDGEKEDVVKIKGD